MTRRSSADNAPERLPPSRPDQQSRSRRAQQARRKRSNYVAAGTTRPPARPQMTPELIAELAQRLTRRDRWLLELLHEHRTLTTFQIRDLAFPSISTATHRMLALYRLQAVQRFRPATATGSAPWHYVLGPAGAAVLAHSRSRTPAQIGYRPDKALQIAHSDKLAHLVGANDLFVRLIAHARTHPGTRLETWWSEQRCLRAWGKIVRPDGYGRWHDHGRAIAFFVEYDTGAQPLHRLPDKLNDYTALADLTGLTSSPPAPANHPGQAADKFHSPTPEQSEGTGEIAVLFVLPSQAREAHLHALAGHHPHPGVTIATTCPVALHTAGGPAGPAWQPLDPTGIPARHHLTDLTSPPGLPAAPQAQPPQPYAPAHPHSSAPSRPHRAHDAARPPHPPAGPARGR